MSRVLIRSREVMTSCVLKVSFSVNTSPRNRSSATSRSALLFVCSKETYRLNVACSWSPIADTCRRSPFLPEWMPRTSTSRTNRTTCPSKSMPPFQLIQTACVGAVGDRVARRVGKAGDVPGADASFPGRQLHATGPLGPQAVLTLRQTCRFEPSNNIPCAWTRAGLPLTSTADRSSRSVRSCSISPVISKDRSPGVGGVLRQTHVAHHGCFIHFRTCGSHPEPQANPIASEFQLLVRVFGRWHSRAALDWGRLLAAQRRLRLASPALRRRVIRMIEPDFQPGCFALELLGVRVHVALSQHLHWANLKTRGRLGSRRRFTRRQHGRRLGGSQFHFGRRPAAADLAAADWPRVPGPGLRPAIRTVRRRRSCPSRSR